MVGRLGLRIGTVSRKEGGAAVKLVLVARQAALERG